MPKRSFGKFDTFEKTYARQLRKISRTVAGIIEGHTVDGVIVNPQALQDQLKAYSDILDPWAKAQAERMSNTVSAWNKRTFASQSKAMGLAMKEVMANSVVGGSSQIWQAKQVELIKSLPLEAAKKAQALSREAAQGGIRAEGIAGKIKNLGSETNANATRIARTEIAKANASLTKARAEFVGATHYIWRTMDDAKVRDSHAEMDDRIFAFAQPPTLSDRTTGNPGEFPNCRCYAEPIFVDDPRLIEFLKAA
ncbi:MAG: minor capsid protein [Candidatus Diapherotrites archaeon]|nr:minor capsid protein [Candidatus Diapherotrites archaeon]